MSINATEVHDTLPVPYVHMEKEHSAQLYRGKLTPLNEEYDKSD